MKFSVLWLLLLLPLTQASAQSANSEDPQGPLESAPSGVVGSLIPNPPELDPELNYCLNVSYQVELRQHLNTHPDDHEAVVRFALLQGLCELVFDGLIDENTAMKLWSRESMD